MATIPVGAHHKGFEYNCSTYHWWNGPWHVQQLIKCQAERSGVDTYTALRVADCESNFTPGSPGDDPAGVFQHQIEYWYGRVNHYAPQVDKKSPYNARTNTIVTTRMVNDVGWSPWSCY